MIKPGDTLEISVWGHDDLRAAIIVREDGMISFPLVGEVMASDLTAPQLCDILRSRLADYIKNPSVTVVVKQERPLRIQVLGCVRTPGVYSFQGQAFVSDAIAAAGGTTPEGDLTAVTVTRRERSVHGGSGGAITVNLEELLSGRGDRGPLVLQDGDIVYVPRALRVRVIGWVEAPGEYLMQVGSRLMDALTRAGGVKPGGDAAAVTLTRDTVINVNVDDIVSGRNPAANVLLKDQDIISVPELIRQVSVLGEVAKPGVYDIKKDTRLLDVIALAGGATEQGDTSSVVVTRRDGGEARSY
ncbi:MAG TPA: hypothetical protein GX506_00270, partial [Firmicutes bacterium]|nr:hypothetical protein [Bacillota bacterium]